MLVVQVEFLTGRYVASAYNDRLRAEWPPHPARLYSALVATWAETGGPDDEATALDVLATLPAPEILAPEIQRARDSSTYYVPVNDASVVRTYDGNWRKMNEAWSKRQEARVALAGASDPKVRERLERTIKSSSRTIEKLRETVAGFLTGGKLSESNLTVLPEWRTKQPRHFPSVVPDDSRVVMVWPDAAPMESHLEALDRLLARVHRMGHSHSLVFVRRLAEAPDANWVPNADGDTPLRWVGPGQREALVEYYELHQGVEPRVMPTVPVPYRRAEEVAADTDAPASALAGDFIVYERAGGPPIPITMAASLARTIHRALVKMAEQLPNGTVHPAVCGRDPDGKVTRESHVLILPLPYVASTYADGSIMGVAFVIPKAVSDEGRIHVLRALGRWERHTNPGDRAVMVHLGPQGSLELRRILGRSDRHNLQPHTWCRASSSWVSATPIALDRNPKTLWARDAQAAAEGERRAIETLSKACERIGLPRPEQVLLERSAPLTGTEPVSAHPSYSPSGQGPMRVLVHARIRFPQAVQGPVVLGAGRFAGAGLLRPVSEKRATGEPLKEVR